MTPENGAGASQPACCRPVQEREGRGFLWGLFYGLVPHTFCILFIVLSVVGATAATAFVQRVLYVPYLFEIVIALSVGFAVLSAVFYLRRNGSLSWQGARRRGRYLAIMFGTTLAVNLLFFWVVFPALANLDLSERTVSASTRPLSAIGAVAESAPALSTVTLQVSIPCPGHAPLILSALREAAGVRSARYENPNLFLVGYDPSEASVETILARPVFEAFPAAVLP